MIVTGIGQCSLDHLALIDIYPPADTKKEILELHEQGGGPVATALVALSRWGVKCRFHGVVGDDDAGKKIQLSLIEEGVAVSGLVVRKKAVSQVAFIAIEKETATRTIFWRSPGGRLLQPEELGADFLDGSALLLLDGLMKDVSIYAAEKAREYGIPIMLDAGRLRAGMPDLMKLSDYVVASEEFARDLGWDPCRETLLREREKLGVKVLTVTLGERGSMTASSDNDYIEIPAFQVHAVDTTGAGDVFHGGYIYGLLKNWSIKETVTFASAAAAMKCAKIGGRYGIPRLSEVKEFLSARGR
jgi:sulfofructose kinase